MKRFFNILLAVFLTVITLSFSACDLSLLSKYFSGGSSVKQVFDLSEKSYEFYSLSEYQITNKLNHETGKVEKEKYYHGTYFVGDKHNTLAGEDGVFQKTSLMICFKGDGSLLMDGEDFVDTALFESMRWNLQGEDLTIWAAGKIYTGYASEEGVILESKTDVGGVEIKLMSMFATDTEKDTFGLYTFQALIDSVDGYDKMTIKDELNEDGVVVTYKMLHVLLMPNGKVFMQSDSISHLQEKVMGDWTMVGNKIYITGEKLETAFDIPDGIVFEKMDNVLQWEYEMTKDGVVHGYKLLLST